MPEVTFCLSLPFHCGCWRGYLSGARCRLAYGPADATATHSLLLSKIHPGSPGKRAFEWVCVCSIVDMTVLKKSMPSRERVKLSSNPNNMAEKTAEHFRNKRNIDYIQFAYAALFLQ